MSSALAGRTIDDYMALPYTLILKRDEEGDIVARIKELEGCIAHGDDETEAIQNLRSAQRVWIESCLDSHHPIPEPEVEDVLPSGKWVQRVPRSLHLKLVQMARSEEVSLNQLVTSILAGAAAAPKPKQAVTHSHGSGVIWGGVPDQAGHARWFNGAIGHGIHQVETSAPGFLEDVQRALLISGAMLPDCNKIIDELHPTEHATKKHNKGYYCEISDHKIQWIGG